ncbi:MAG: hypothetical protein QW569_01655 [Candidatus Bathyarchaeia archaeon]|nr:hypothetical protein [Candidatus Bathyarchaeota archaeon]
MEAKFSEHELEDIMYGRKTDLAVILKNTVRDLIREHPFLCLALTLALGIALGAALTESRRIR